MMPSPPRPPGHGGHFSQSTSPYVGLCSENPGQILDPKHMSIPRLQKEFRSQSKLVFTTWNCHSMCSLKLQPVSYAKNCFTPDAFLILQFGNRFALAHPTVPSSLTRAEQPQLCFIPATAGRKNDTLFTMKMQVMQWNIRLSETTNVIVHLSAILRKWLWAYVSYRFHWWQTLMSKKQEKVATWRNFMRYNVRISFLNW